MSASSILPPSLPPSPARRSVAPPRAWTESYGVARHPVWLFGAGHVGRALVLALAPLPFALTWCDSREGAFPAHIPANVTPLHHDAPDELVARIPAGAFVLVMSHSHPIDLAVTAAALARDDLPFVGLIGSRTKRARFEKRYRELGIADARNRAAFLPDRDRGHQRQGSRHHRCRDGGAIACAARNAAPSGDHGPCMTTMPAFSRMRCDSRASI